MAIKGVRERERMLRVYMLFKQQVSGLDIFRISTEEPFVERDFGIDTKEASVKSSFGIGTEQASTMSIFRRQREIVGSPTNFFILHPNISLTVSLILLDTKEITLAEVVERSILELTAVSRHFDSVKWFKYCKYGIFDDQMAVCKLRSV